MAEYTEKQKRAFRTVLVDVGETLTEKQTKSLAFESGITRNQMGNSLTGWEIFDMVWQKGFIDPGNVDPLLELLEKRNLKDGSDFLQKYKDKYQKGAANTESKTPRTPQTPSTPPSKCQSDQPNQGNGAKNIVDDDIIMMLSSHLLNEWRVVGRGLNLTEAEIQNLTVDVRSGQREIIYQMLIIWKKKHGYDATYGVLIEALKMAGRRDLIDRIRYTEEL